MRSSPVARPRATVLLPAYDEEDGLAAVLEDLAPLRREGIDVLVIDDGSADATAEVARAAGQPVLRLERNQGKAGAIRAGLAAVVGSDKIIVIDADGTYPVSAIVPIVRLLDEHDLVLGARMEGRDQIPRLNRAGNAVLRSVIRLFAGFRSADPLTGLYGIRRAHLEAMELRSDGFGLEAEICVKAARMGLRWRDYPIAYGPRIGASKLHPLRDGWTIGWTILRTLFGGPRVRPRLRQVAPPPAPLATAVTAGSLVLMAIGLVAMLAALGPALAAVLVPPGVDVTRLMPPGVVAFSSGLLLWHLAAHWGHPRRPALAPLAAAFVGLGAVLVVASVLLVEMADAGVPGIGPAQQALLAAAAVVIVGAPLAVVLVRRAPRLHDWLSRPLLGRAALASRGEALVLVGILMLFAVPVVRLVLIGQVFGFDEAIYALTARAWLEGTPNTGWSLHRSPGISVLGVPALLAPSEAAFRSVGVVFGLGALIVIWRLGRRLAGPTAGLLAALVVATIPDLQLNASLFLTDVPSAAVVLLFMLGMWVVFEGDRSLRRLVWLAPIAAIAFYVRYGAALPLAFVAATSLLVWPRRLLRGWRHLVVALTVLLVLLLPHLIPAVGATGSPWGIATLARDLAAPEYLGQALEGYVHGFTSDLAGPVAGAFMTLGVLAWPARLLASGWRHPESRALTFLVLPALGQGVLLGLLTLAQTRYVFVPLMLLCVAGTVAATSVARSLGIAWRRVLAIALVATVLVISLGRSAETVGRQAAYGPTQWKIADAGQAIRADATGECAVLSYLVPQITWYSGCATYHFGTPPRAGAERFLTANDRYLLLFIGQTERQPTGRLLEAYLELVEPEPVAIISDHDTGRLGAIVYRLRE